MSQLVDGWDIVSRRNNEPARTWLMLLQLLFTVPGGVQPHSSVTWTLRETATGAVRKVTAQTEQEAKDKIALGLFDDD